MATEIKPVENNETASSFSIASQKHKGVSSPHTS